MLRSKHLLLGLCLIVFLVLMRSDPLHLRSQKSSTLTQSTSFKTELIPHRHLSKLFYVMWFKDQASDLALGVNVGDFKDSFFGTRIHEAILHPREYSCYPDDVILFSYLEEETRAERGVYAGYLHWVSRASTRSVDGEPDSALSSYYFAPQYGFIERYIEPHLLNEMDVPPAEIEVQHLLTSGRPWVTTKIRLTNKSNLAMRYQWIAQDAVVLDLSRNNQTEVLTVSPAQEAQYEVFDGAGKNWIGVRDRTLHSGTAIYSPDASEYFALPTYLAVVGFPVEDCKAQGLDCALEGNDRFAMRSKSDARSQSQIILASSAAKTFSPQSLKVTGLVLDLGEVKPGETVERQYVRIPVRDVSSADSFREQVEHTLRQANLASMAK